MNIDNLTIGEFKELAALFGQKKTSIPSYVGQYVIVRSYNEGINAGYVVAHDETGIVLKDARRLYYHKPADSSLSWYEGVAVSGLSNDSIVSGAVSEKVIIEKYSITLCSDKAKESIINAAAQGS